MANEKILKTQICDEDLSLCQDVFLKIPLDEVEKLQSMELSKSNEWSSLSTEYDFAQIWGFAFSVVIFFYLTGLGIGIVLDAIKQFTR